ncbi:von Willebrand factor type A domain-containing protein [Polymorphospora lycopeni]|uniref:von Willebrand factor type A domain-containing protein n=1 Tax=Polymorphospora lycopeni TaxID=3140240 RepID=A0ABV5CI52_9ACTN
MVRFRRPSRAAVLVVALSAVLAGSACTAERSASDTAAHRNTPTQPDRRTEHSPIPFTGGETRTDEDPQSTFGVDVDTASYGYARRLINDGRLPDGADIRPEEFVNAFDQEYPEPAGDGFAIHVDGARLPDRHRPEPAGDVRLLRVGLQTRGEDPATRPDAALTFVVDVSGSMREPGRLDLVQDALHTLVDQLRDTDSVAIVAFSREARTIRKMTRAGDADALHDAIDSLKTQNSTNLEAGLELGYRVARDGFREGASNRVILLSDGLANVGNDTAEPILARVHEEAAKQIALLGVGVGSDYGDSLMEQLADRGDGFVVYVSEPEQAREVFVRRLPATLAVRALDAKVQVTFDPAAVRAYRLIGYANRAIADEDFRDDRVDGGEVGPGHSVTALYAVRVNDRVPAGARVATVDVRWLDPQDRSASETSSGVTAGALTGEFEAAPARLRVCYAAGYFAEALRGGSEATYADLATVADRAAGETEDRQVDDLAKVIRRAGTLD